MTRSIYTDPQPSDFGIERLLEPEEIDQLTVAEYREYERKLRNYRDWKNTIVTAKKMAYERGFKEGMAESRPLKYDRPCSPAHTAASACATACVARCSRTCFPSH